MRAEMNMEVKRIPTVLGSISGEEMGWTLIHEHLLFTLVKAYGIEPSGVYKRRLSAKADVCHRGVMMNDPYSYLDNWMVDDPDLASEEVLEFLAAGGNTIVEVTSTSIGRDVRGLARIAAKTGVNIICGTGHYIADSHPAEVAEASVDELARRMIDDITDGIDGTRIKAGVIGEIGTSTPITPEEAKVVEAACIAQRETGRPMVIHPAAGSDQPFEVVKLLSKYDAIMDLVVMSHLDGRFRDDLDRYQRLADLGPMLALDTFGRELFLPAAPRQHPTDEMRIQTIVGLLDRGLEERVLVSQDIGFKTDLTRFGGHGYGHVLGNLWPRFKAFGITEDQLHQMMVLNPRRLLEGK